MSASPQVAKSAAGDFRVVLTGDIRAVMSTQRRVQKMRLLTRLSRLMIDGQKSYFPMNLAPAMKPGEDPICELGRVRRTAVHGRHRSDAC